MSELKPQRYKDSRPAEAFQPVHEHSRTHEPNWVYQFCRLIVTWPALFLYRTRAISTANVPDAGPVILAPNHFSNMDHFFAGLHIRRRIRFMGKSQLFGRNRVLDYIYKYGGVFPVRRGHHDEETFITAHAILERGGCVLIYAEGGRSRTGTLGEAKPGVGRLALESGLPVVPVAIHGSKGVRAWKRLSFPKVTVQYGDPISFAQVEHPTREQQLAASQQVFDQVKLMYAALDERGRGKVIKSLREGAAAAAAAPDPRTRAHS
jgi:1-acyl-sn-glycerol-3-phosphate acyltransferase